MKQRGDLVSLGSGLYTLPLELLAGGALHEFEIALALAKQGAISHHSAFSYYGLTDQILNRTYVTVPKIPDSNLSSQTNYVIEHNEFNLIRVAPKYYWGHKNVFISEARICITDLERTLIDGLTHPQYCGGFFEVINAFDRGVHKCSPERLYDYAQKTSLVVCKRLGWVLEKIDQFKDVQIRLLNLPMNYAQRLDPTGKRTGSYNKTWMLMENIH
jgi:predicted transcriptional regulator of viral defense system